jgi:hypothetical protein
VGGRNLNLFSGSGELPIQLIDLLWFEGVLPSVGLRISSSVVPVYRTLITKPVSDAC